jgi:hypothetical protein
MWRPVKSVERYRREQQIGPDGPDAAQGCSGPLIKGSSNPMCVLSISSLRS